jgi:hypothetical protein
VANKGRDFIKREYSSSQIEDVENPRDVARFE